MNDVSHTNACIAIRGARVHNLRDVDVDIPHGELVVVTGVSGSGKSSLALDTIFAEGQRRYLICLASRTSLLLADVQRPDVDQIDGLPPTLSIDQHAGTAHIRSTLATTTEIYDFLRLLYARAGQAHCPRCGRPVAQQTPAAMVDAILRLEERRKVMVLAPIIRGRRGEHRDVFQRIAKEGFVRARVDGQIVDVASPPDLARSREHDIDAVIDRLIIKPGIRQRLRESVDAALRLGDGLCLVTYQDGDAWRDLLFSDRSACRACDLSFPDLEPRTFSFNSPYGACPRCRGLGRVPLEETSARSRRSRHGGRRIGTVPVDAPLDQPTVLCHECQGSRLGAFARSVTFFGKAIHEIAALSVTEALKFFGEVAQTLSAVQDRPDVHVALTSLPPSSPSGAAGDLLTPPAHLAVSKVLPEILRRLRFLQEIGLGYLTLDRPTRSLSGGEYQRARLAACLGSGITGACYVLDEPTVGLHPRDTDRLIESLRRLRDAGNTVLVVEHEPAVMRQADYVIDLGPGAGQDGGRVVAVGTPTQVARSRRSITARYLRDGAVSLSPKTRSSVRSAPRLELRNATRHNLKNLTVRIPLKRLVAVTGVSGSGKTSLVTETLVPVLRRALAAADQNLARESEHRGRPTGAHCPDESEESAEKTDRAGVVGAEQLSRVIEIDRSPIGRTPRSTPATYCGIWDEVRRIFARTREARVRGFTARRFSFNASPGRCPHCAGQGYQRLEMPLLSDLLIECPQCDGARYNRATLTVRYRGRTIADILEMRMDEAAEFFRNFPSISRILETFVDIGLGYLKLGQPSPSLSGGEAQRVKLATELSRPSASSTLFVLDEPTTGLHPADVENLIRLLWRLVEQGHSVLIIEHNLDVIAACDWIIDLGPEGGDAGGRIVTTGTPRQVARCKRSYTGRFLAQWFSRAGD
ncbi:MAG: ABC-ATPase UvrA [Planctomycetes bacterium]|nr:ABC-ATPase UvrA [Planctomycetota bacterium]